MFSLEKGVIIIFLISWLVNKFKNPNGYVDDRSPQEKKKATAASDEYVAMINFLC